VRDATPPGAKVTTMDTGRLGYFSAAQASLKARIQKDIMTNITITRISALFFMMILLYVLLVLLG
jgi:hypothetical protein